MRSEDQNLPSSNQNGPSVLDKYRGENYLAPMYTLFLNFS